MKKFLVVCAALVAFAMSGYARKVTGTIMCGEEFLENVVVTDGVNFAATNFKGKYVLEVDDNADYVYIITPAGYVADWSTGVPAFYKKVAGQKKVDFNIQKTTGGFDYNIIAIADPQTSTEQHHALFAGKPMEDIIATAKSLAGVTVGLSLGDISWDNLERLTDYKKEIVRAGVPFYPVIGNHDYAAWCKGDKESASYYREMMGPENYAFWLGKDVVIVLDNIIYDTNYKSQDGYSDDVLAWVKGFMSYVPADADIYIAQHVPTGRHKRKIHQTNKLLDIVRGHKVTFLSGHTHVNNNFTIERNITEHNIAAICGAWWDTELCTDGTPKGYKVFTKFGGKLSWYYKPVGHSKKHIAQAFSLGETLMHPNSVVVNVWDWDPQWSVKWYEDGVDMGNMDQVRESSPAFNAEIEAAYKKYGEEIPGWKRGRPSGHYFAATPSRYAKRITISVESRFGQKWTQVVDIADFVETETFVKAEEITFDKIKDLAVNGSNSVAFDLHVAMDGQVRAGDAKGLLLTELIDSTDAVLSKMGHSPLRYNIVMHTAKNSEEGKSVPYYHDYADYVMDGLWMKFMGDRLMVTGYDYRSLNHLNSRYPEVDIAFQVAEGTEDIEKAMERLKFKPRWISLHYTLATEALVGEWQKKGYCVSVWGVPDKETENRIKALGPDAVIF